MAEARYRRGDRVCFRVGVQTVSGIVTEDIGPVGVGGRRLYGIEFSIDPALPEPRYVELPAVDFRPASAE